LEEILTLNFLGIQVGLKLFCIFTSEMMVKSLWNHSTYTLKLLFGPLWKHSTCTLQMLLVAPVKARYLCITNCWGPFESIVLTHYNCCWQPLLKQGILHYSYCWGPLWKHNSLLTH